MSRRGAVLFIGMAFLLCACQANSSPVEESVVIEKESSVSSDSEAAGINGEEDEWPALEESGHFNGVPREGYSEVTGYNTDFGDSVPNQNKVTFDLYKAEKRMEGEVLFPAFSTGESEVIYSFSFDGKQGKLTEWKQKSTSSALEPDEEQIESTFRTLGSMFFSE